MQPRIWIDRCHKYTFIDGESAFQVNFAGMNFAEEELAALESRFENVHAEMQKIEIGEIKNPDENRKVTHFTDRSVYTGSEIFADVEEFVEGVRSGAITGSTSPWETDDPGVTVYNVEDFVAAEIRFDNGSCLHVETSYNMNLQDEANNVELYGTKAGLMLNPLELYKEMGEKLVNIPVKPQNPYNGDALNDEDLHFVDCILNGTPCIADADDGLQAMKIIDAIYESGRTGKSVQL